MAIKIKIFKLPKLGKTIWVKAGLRKKPGGGLTTVKAHFSHAKPKKR